MLKADAGWSGQLSSINTEQLEYICIRNPMVYGSMGTSISICYWKILLHKRWLSIFIIIIIFIITTFVYPYFQWLQGGGQPVSLKIS